MNRKKGGLGESGKGVLEIANAGKYFSVTGDRLQGTYELIAHNPKGLRRVFDMYFPPKSVEIVSPAKPSITLEDDEILQRAGNAKNGEAFKKLFAGDWSDYSSQSEADMALCCMLAFWCGNNAEQIDRLFRQSGLYRQKWGREDYRTQTIGKAIESTKEPYQGKKPESATACKTETRLIFPDIMKGFAERFAGAYSEISEAPKVFYYFGVLTCLGSYLSGRIKLNTLLNVQPRLYVVFLGPSGRGRKSTPITIGTEFFLNVVDDFSILHHANSGEGLGVHLEKHRNTLLCYDEFLGFVAKAVQKGNTLLGTVTTLFEKNAYQTATKDKQLVIEDAHLSMLGACTTDTWERCWEADFTAIGLNNRLFLVPGAMDTFVSIPPRLDENVWRDLRDELRTLYSHALKIKEYSLTPQAYALYDTWYKEKLDHKSVHAVRLDQYALRFMLLFAVNEQKDEIDTEIVRDVIDLVEWEHKVRQQLDPIDVDNEMAKVETRIRRALMSGPKSKRELQQRTAASRSGKWIWGNALQNLIHDEEVRYDQKDKLYFLVNENV